MINRSKEMYLLRESSLCVVRANYASHQAKSTAMLCYSLSEIARNVESRDTFSNKGKNDKKKRYDFSRQSHYYLYFVICTTDKISKLRLLRI